MNLNEECLLYFLINPQELENLTAKLEENIQFVNESSLVAASRHTR